MKNLHLVCDTKCKKLQKSILKEMSKNDVYFKALYEIVRNIYLKNIKLKQSDKLKLKKNAKVLNNILSNPKSKRKRSLLVNQSGGFLPFILPLVGTAISELISYAIGKKVTLVSPKLTNVKQFGNGIDEKTENSGFTHISCQD
jgi:hypothetical protein